MTLSRERSTVDLQLHKALSHPLRQRILQQLVERGPASPKQIADTLQEPLGNVSYHVKMLREFDCVELVDTRQRRGAIEHFYRATSRAWLDDEQWARLPVSVRRQTVGRTLTELFEHAVAASQTGGFDDPEIHVSRTYLEVDELGWRELANLLGETLDAAVRINAESAARRAEVEADAAPIRSELGILHFHRSPPDG
jgi:DNA-binding transcriptional ArsR family regulator